MKKKFRHYNYRLETKGHPSISTDEWVEWSRHQTLEKAINNIKFVKASGILGYPSKVQYRIRDVKRNTYLPGELIV